MDQVYRTTSVRAVIRKEDQILVEWFAPKSISFLPGGTVEGGEDLRAALNRELAEEVAGVKVSVGRYLGKIGHIWSTPKGKDSCLNHYFEAQIAEGESPSAREPGRLVKWLSLFTDEAKTLQPPTLFKLLQSPIVGEWDLVDSSLNA